jgi:hypothetical protein
MGDDELARAVLARYGTTYADEAGIRLADEHAPLFQLLVLAQLLSARIGAGVAVATARELFAAGWITPARLRDAVATLVVERYAADLHGLAGAAGEDVGRAAALVQEVEGIGPTGAAVFLREVQAVWPWVRPFLDDRARDGARRLGLPDDATALAGLVDGDDLARFAAALVRVGRLPASRDPLSG